MHMVRQIKRETGTGSNVKGALCPLGLPVGWRTGRVVRRGRAGDQGPASKTRGKAAL